MNNIEQQVRFTQDRLDYTLDTLGSVFHACFRQVCDSDPATKVYNAINDMEDQLWRDLCQIVAEQIIFGWDAESEYDERVDIVRANVENIHTALRKFASGAPARTAWEAIRELPTEEWVQVVEWTTKRVVSQLEKFEEQRLS